MGSSVTMEFGDVRHGMDRVKCHPNKNRCSLHGTLQTQKTLFKKKAIEKEELKTSRHLFAYTENLSLCAYAPHDELLARSIRTESNREKRERSTVAATARQSLQTQHALRPQESLKKLVSFQNEKGKKKTKN